MKYVSKYYFVYVLMIECKITITENALQGVLKDPDDNEFNIGSDWCPLPLT